MKRALGEAETYEIDYPFVWKKYEPSIPGDPIENSGEWKPGVVRESSHNGDTFTYCHGMGKLRFTVIDRFLPKGCREYTFYRREWTDPQGRVFGSRKLHMKATHAFMKLTKGYIYPVEDIITDGTPLEKKEAA